MPVCVLGDEMKIATVRVSMPPLGMEYAGAFQEFVKVFFPDGLGTEHGE